jgi:hypothetical protein
VGHQHDVGALTWWVCLLSPSSILVLAPSVGHGLSLSSVVAPLSTRQAEAHSGGAWVDGCGMLVFVVSCWWDGGGRCIVSVTWQIESEGAYLVGLRVPSPLPLSSFAISSPPSCHLSSWLSVTPPGHGVHVFGIVGLNFFS